MFKKKQKKQKKKKKMNIFVPSAGSIEIFSHFQC